ncbi:protein kinase family protein [Bacillus sp. FSL K6-3431]|uniref:protein kinase family protein n=1 Tax=Bacillus sp. FSL K6-3431 TaxID=2921500 RepID=UPI0030F6E159
MYFFKKLAESVIITNKHNKPEIIKYDDSLTLVGVGRSAFVFKIQHTNKALKVFFPTHRHLAQEEADVYKSIQHIDFYSALHEAGINYIVIDFIEGYTFFECLTRGIRISEKEIQKVDLALKLARKEGLNPSDIHLRNILITSNKDIKMIDVARFRQRKACNQWLDLKTAFYRYYNKRFFPKKIPAFILNWIAAFYKFFHRQNTITGGVS